MIAGQQTTHVSLCEPLMRLNAYGQTVTAGVPLWCVVSDELHNYTKTGIVQSSDDIVTRLRACWCHDAFRDRGRVDPACDHDGVREEAADEIEKLRMLGTQLLNAVNYYLMEGNEATEDVIELIKAWREAVGEL